MRRLPDWIGIGCVKCGTSWAWSQLKKHPQIYSPYKELNYFNFGQIFQLKSYISFFEGGENHQKTGEWTPDYFHHYEAMHNIKEIVPWVKLITIFRHPIDRAWSNYKHALQEGRTKRTFNECWKFHRVSQRSVYSIHLKRWYELFPKDQIKVMWYEDIKEKPLEFLQELFRFLDVDDTFVPENYNEQFEFHYHKNEEINNLKLSEEDRQEWLKRYLPFTEELEEITDRDLSHWKK
jgi:hypothetical protein